MNRLASIASLLLFLTACVPGGVLAPTATPTAISTGTPIPEPITGEIRGRVMDSRDGSLIPFVNVSTDPPTGSVTTDGQGNYSISGVPPGNYRVTASKLGYPSASVSIAVVANRTTTADIHLAASATSIRPTATPIPTMTPNASKDLVAYYPFNGNANDESGNGHHGTAYGATLTMDRFENPDSAYLFDGVDDYIALPDNLNLIDTDFSISAWVKPSDYGIKSPVSQACLRLILSYRYRHDSSATAGNPVNGGLRFGLHEDSGCGGNNHLSAVFFESGFRSYAVRHEYDSTEWFLYTVTRASEEMIIYVNGEAVSWSEISGATLYENPAHQYSTIGAQRVETRVGGAFPFAGVIDDVRIYNYALSESQIREDLLSMRVPSLNYDSRCSYGSWNVIYTADDLPGNSEPAWFSRISSSAIAGVKEGILALDTISSVEERAYFGQNWNASNISEAIVETRMRLDGYVGNPSITAQSYTLHHHIWQ